MLVFHEGLPRSGKSYDCVRAHVLPAIASGRRVYARINGLDHAKIAAYLNLPVERVEELLTIVTTAQVKNLFIAKRDMNSADQDWFIEDELKDALFVVDEAHEFYVASREAINPAIEQFFALCGQNGMDGVLMSQWYRRLHSSLRARIERRNVYQKMTAAGMQGKYTCKMYHATAPDRFELVDTVIASYDPKIFPLYSGYAPGASNAAVYTAGGVTVWKRVRKYSIIVVPVVGVAAYVFLHFLHGDGGMVKTKSVGVPHASLNAGQAGQGSVMHQTAAAVTASAPAVKPQTLQRAHVETKAMPDEVAYVFNLTNQARPRLAAIAVSDVRTVGLVEWVPDSGAAIERLTFDQLRALGIQVKVTDYGVRLAWKSDNVVVTAWPLPVATQSDHSGQGQGQGYPAVAQAIAPAAPDDASVRYPERKTAANFVPPEAMSPQSPSTWKPSGGQASN